MSEAKRAWGDACGASEKWGWRQEAEYQSLDLKIWLLYAWGLWGTCNAGLF